MKELLSLRRVRDVHWNPKHKESFLELKDTDILSLGIQVTGEEAPKPCTGCRRGLGPYASCVVLPSTASSKTVMSRRKCANCLYQGNAQVDCSLRKWSGSRACTKPAAAPPPTTPRRNAKANGQAGRSASKHFAHTPTQRGRPAKAPRTDGRASRASSLSSSGRQPEGPRRLSTSQSQTTNEGDVFTGNRVRVGKQSTALPARANSHQPVFAGQIVPSAVLRMEDWEIAPGRIGIRIGDDDTNVAFSRAYLSSNQAVQVTDTMSVRVRTLGPGAALNLQFEPDSDKPRVCTLIAGQLQVKMGDDEEFTIGPGGLFVVRPGVAARLQNRIFLDCVLHVVVSDE